MSFFIYDAVRDRISQLQHFDSVQWLENYQSPGEVKIVAQMTPENLAILIDGNRVHNSETDTSARISHVDLDDVGDKKIITARADITSELLSDRVVMGTVHVTNVEAGMYSIYSRNRGDMPIAVGTAQGFTEQTNMEITWNSVLEAQKRLAEVSGLGFKVEFDPENGAERFIVYKGVDRSKDTSLDYVGYFGTDVDGIEKVTVSSGTTGYKNVAVVAGAGEGANRTVRIVSIGRPTGENRRELFVDARDLQWTYQVAIPTGTVDAQGNPIFNFETRTHTTAGYNALLDARGLEKLAENLKDFSMTCGITQNNIIFGVDYFLGDRIPIKLPEYGIFASARLTSATGIYETEGKAIIGVLSDFELEGS